ncbi:serine hydrolase domain-containing protein, partial [Muriicola sp.]|uniref:serine hydrolase domain-containing protein n=1 Tax=Muriicola sp. TaxID=2020856 RepID=UPI003C78A430
MNKLPLILIFFILLACGDKSKTNNNEDLKKEKDSIIADSLTSEINKLQKEGHINGFAVAVVNQNGTLYEHGFGYANVKTNENYTEHTIQNIASISKTFIGIALLKAQELGKLDLDDPINKHLPFKVINPYYPKEPITIKQLATHTSTIIDTEYYDTKSYVLKDSLQDSNVEGMVENFNPPQTKIPIQEFLKKILQDKGELYKKEGFLKSKPGEKFEYSNIAATLAAVVLENATGEAFDTFTTKYILEPLNMSSSGWSFESVDFSKHSKLYSNLQTELPFYSLITYPDGGMLTSAHDLAKYLTELIKGKSGNGTILNSNSYEEFFSEQLSAEHFTEQNKDNPYNDEYNIGIFIGHSGNGNIGHTGGDPGVSTLLFFNPKTSIGRLLIINTSLTNQEGVNQFYGIMDKLG